MIWVVLAVAVIILYFAFRNQEPKPVPWTGEEIKKIKAYSDQHPDRYEFNVKGLHMVSYQKRLAKCTATDVVTLEPEPENKYDSNAIKVMTDVGLIGYVPAEKTDYVGHLISNDHDAFIGDITDDNGYVNCVIAINYNYKKNKN